MGSGYYILPSFIKVCPQTWLASYLCYSRRCGSLLPPLRYSDKNSLHTRLSNW